MKSTEQKARDMLERAGVKDAQSLTAGDVIEIANLIADNSRLRSQLEQVTAEREAMREALKNISDFDARDRNGYLDEWEEAWAYDECKKIAAAALKGGKG